MRKSYYEQIATSDLGQIYVRIQEIQLLKQRAELPAFGSVFMFFAFMVVGPVLFVIKEITLGQFLLLLTAALVIFIIASAPYIASLKREQHALQELHKNLNKKR